MQVISADGMQAACVAMSMVEMQEINEEGFEVGGAVRTSPTGAPGSSRMLGSPP